MRLFMVLLGCKPQGRHTEQHDIYFGVAKKLPAMVPEMKAFWPEAGTMHVDVWRHVAAVGEHSIKLVRNTKLEKLSLKKLYFVNLGGYKAGSMEEYHYKQLVVATTPERAAAAAKRTTFYKTHISPHIDDHYGLDVDDIYAVEDLLSPEVKANYSIEITLEKEPLKADKLHIGDLKFEDLESKM